MSTRTVSIVFVAGFAMTVAGTWACDRGDDFANLLGEFNIITQYAGFELLRRQAPEEAQRLGVAE